MTHTFRKDFYPELLSPLLHRNQPDFAKSLANAVWRLCIDTMQSRHYKQVNQTIGPTCFQRDASVGKPCLESESELEDLATTDDLFS